MGETKVREIPVEVPLQLVQETAVEVPRLLVQEVVTQKLREEAQQRIIQTGVMWEREIAREQAVIGFGEAVQGEVVESVVRSVRDFVVPSPEVATTTAMIREDVVVTPTAVETLPIAAELVTNIIDGGMGPSREVRPSMRLGGGAVVVEERFGPGGVIVEEEIFWCGNAPCYWLDINGNLIEGFQMGVDGLPMRGRNARGELCWWILPNGQVVPGIELGADGMPIRWLDVNGQPRRGKHLGANGLPGAHLNLGLDGLPRGGFVAGEAGRSRRPGGAMGSRVSAAPVGTMRTSGLVSAQPIGSMRTSGVVRPSGMVNTVGTVLR